MQSKLWVSFAILESRVKLSILQAIFTLEKFFFMQGTVALKKGVWLWRRIINGLSENGKSTPQRVFHIMQSTSQLHGHEINSGL